MTHIHITQITPQNIVTFCNDDMHQEKEKEGGHIPGGNMRKKDKKKKSSDDYDISPVHSSITQKDLLAEPVE